MNAQLIVIQRDAAKQLFAIRDPAELLSFIQELIDDSGVLKLQVPSRWPEYDRAFADAEGEQAAIQWALTGGREMAIGDENRLYLKRPDIVAQLAQAIEQFAESIVGEEDFHDSDFCRDLAGFYSRAAEQQAAVLFLN
jgi:hypothetical protein